MQDDGDIDVFQAITGADRATAEHVLEAHGWDLNRGVNFFVESASLPPGRLPSGNLQSTEAPERADSIVDVDEEEPARDDRDNPDGPERAAPLTRGARRARLASGAGLGFEATASHLADDDDLQAALAASLRTGNGDGEDDEPAPHASRLGRNERLAQLQGRFDRDPDADSLDEFLSPEEGSPRLDPNAVGRSRYGLPAGFLDADEEGEEPGARLRQIERRGDPAALDMSHLAAMGMAAGIPPTFAQAFQSTGLSHPSVAATANGNGHIDLPDGINMEEARMLEAAMLGIPYEGRIPDFRNQEAAEPVSPSVINQRALREEQDQAYQESLLADKRKADEAEAAKKLVEEAQQRQLRADEDAAEKQRGYEREISDKLSNLPEEPASDDPQAVNVMIRLPNGSRFSRRFLRSSTCEQLFNFVDVNAAPDFKPGSYSLVTQYPRRVFSAGKAGCLEEAGLTQRQEALYLEPI